MEELKCMYIDVLEVAIPQLHENLQGRNAKKVANF